MIYFLSKQTAIEDPAISQLTGTEELQTFVDDILTKRRIATNVIGVDTETTGLNFLDDKLLLLQIGDQTDQYVIDCTTMEVTEIVKPILESRTIVKLLHNAGFDYKFIKSKLGITLENVHDTYLAEKVIHCGKESLRHNLAAVAERRLGIKLNKDEQAKFVGHRGLFRVGQIVYGARDLLPLFSIYTQQVAEARRMNLSNVMKLENHAVLAFSDIELNGMMVDEIQWKKNSDLVLSEEKKALTALYDILEQDSVFKPLRPKYIPLSLFDSETGSSRTALEKSFSFGSPRQVLKLLWLLDSSLTTTDAKVLEGYTKLHPIISVYLNYKKLQKQYSTYGPSFLDMRWSDGRIHTSFQQILNTGRVSSSRPNCFSSDTQVLTPRGWVFFKHLTEDDKVAQWDNGHIMFVKPTACHKYWTDSPLYHLQSESVELLTTADHRILTTTRKGKICRETAVELAEKMGDLEILDRKFVRAGIKSGGKFLSADERQALLSAIIAQAEGHVLPRRIEVSIKGDRKRLQLQEVYAERVTPRGCDRIKVNLRHEEVSDWIELPTKDFKIEKLLELAPEELEWFFDRIHEWDGDSTRKHTYLQHAKRIKSVEAVQLIATLIGKSTKYSERSEVYHVANFHPKAVRSCSRVKFTPVPYSDYVYCVSVPSEKILIRYNNQISVQWNCQNLPANNSYRNCFIAEPGWVFVSSDFASQELCIVAEGSKDPVWLQALIEEKDLHSVCSELVFGDKWKNAAEPNCSYYINQSKCDCKGHKKLRTAVKTVNFGIIYGASKYNLSGQLDISIEEADELIQQYFKTFPSIKKFLDGLAKQGTRTGMIRTYPPYGRIRHFENFQKRRHDSKFIGEVDRASRNMPIQGTAADMVKEALIVIRRTIQDGNLPVKLVMTVHDQIDTICKQEYAEEWKEKLTSIMQTCARRILPSGLLRAETTVSAVWQK